MDSIFLDITVIICVAAFLSFIFRLLHQPEILAYILTGILLGPLGLFQIHSVSALITLGDVGITLLLFMLGLELRLKDFASIGKTAVIIGLLQIWFTFVLGFFFSRLIGYPITPSFFIAVALTISSTVIIVKLFSDKKDLHSLHGKLAIGISLTQDLAAVLLLIFLSDTHFSLTPIVLAEQVCFLLLKIVLVFAVITFISYRIFPFLTSYIARSSESLFLFSLAWVFLLTAVIASPFIGFSIQIGGFLAGLALANTNETYQIVGRMKPLRDFFITIFFVMLGLQMSFAHVFLILPQVLLLTFFALIIKPIIVFLLTSAFGFRKRTSFLASVSLGQISEFSLLVVFLVSRLHYLSTDVETTIILAGLISFAASTYAVQSSGYLYKLFGEYLNFFETKHVHHLQNDDDNEDLENLRNHLVIIGGHQMGMSVIKSLEKDENVLVVDFDPDIVHELRKKGIRSFFGDISDPEIQERARLDKARMVVSTVPDIEDNLLLIERLNKENKKAKIVVMAYELEDAKRLYKAGADYVVLPHLAGGRLLAKILKDEDLSEIEKYRKKDMEFAFD